MISIIYFKKSKNIIILLFMNYDMFIILLFMNDIFNKIIEMN